MGNWADWLRLPSGGSSTSTIRPPVFADSGGLSGRPSPSGPVGPGADQFAAAQARLATRRALIGYGNPSNPYRVGVTRSDQAVMDSQRQGNMLRRALAGQQNGLLDLQGNQIRQTGALYDQTGADITARQGENTRLQTAQNDAHDIEAVGRADAYRADINRGIYDAIGETRPTEVALPSSARGMALSGGLVAANRTNADYIGEDNRAADTTRGLALDQTRNGVALAGNAVADYRNRVTDRTSNAIDLAGIDTNDAQLNAQGFRTALNNAQDQAQYEDQSAGLNSDELRMGPGAGLELYTDPVTLRSEYLTPAEVDDRQYEYSQGNQRRRIGSQYDLNRQREQFAVNQGPLAGYSEADLVNMWAPAGFGSDPDSLTALVNWYKYQGYSDEVARYKAGELVQKSQAQMDAKEKARAGGSSNGPPIALPPRPSATPTNETPEQKKKREEEEEKRRRGG